MSGLGLSVAMNCHHQDSGFPHTNTIPAPSIIVPYITHTHTHICLLPLRLRVAQHKCPHGSTLYNSYTKHTATHTHIRIGTTLLQTHQTTVQTIPHPHTNSTNTDKSRLCETTSQKELLSSSLWFLTAPQQHNYIIWILDLSVRRASCRCI